MKKVVVRLDLHDDKGKKKALKAVSDLTGVDSISMDMKGKKLTVVGTVNPVDIVNKLSKAWHPEIVSVGEAKKEEPKKDAPKKEEDKKKEVEKKKEAEKKKDGSEKKDPNDQVNELVKEIICLLQRVVGAKRVASIANLSL